LVKIGCVFPEGKKLQESFVEVFVAITDQASPYCVASDAMRSNMDTNCGRVATESSWIPSRPVLHIAPMWIDKWYVPSV
jgi:hypothetical protein